MIPDDVRRILETARSVAVVGASKDPAKLGHVLLRNILDYGFAGDVYPVNPSGGEILGRPVYANLTTTPAPPAPRRRPKPSTARWSAAPSPTSSAS